jgi:hypothetical protein
MFLGSDQSSLKSVMSLFEAIFDHNSLKQTEEAKQVTIKNN